MKEKATIHVGNDTGSRGLRTQSRDFCFFGKNFLAYNSRSAESLLANHNSSVRGISSPTHPMEGSWT